MLKTEDIRNARGQINFVNVHSVAGLSDSPISVQAVQKKKDSRKNQAIGIPLLSWQGQQ